MKNIVAILLLLVAAPATALAQSQDRPHKSPEEIAKFVQEAQEKAKERHAAEFAALQERANSGDLDAQVALGNAYRHGTYANPQWDTPKAIEWYEKAATKGSIKAELALADLYTQGEAGKEGWRIGIDWYKKAAEQGDAGAQAKLGDIYSHGPIVQTVENNREIVDQEKSFGWFMKAAEQGNKMGQTAVGLDYKFGRGTTKDDAKAIEWLTKAAEQGEPIAEEALGGYYADGTNVPEDKVTAYKWLDLSAFHNGGNRPFQNRDKLAQTMTPDEITRAKELVKDWKRSKGLRVRD